MIASVRKTYRLYRRIGFSRYRSTVLTFWTYFG